MSRFYENFRCPFCRIGMQVWNGKTEHAASHTCNNCGSKVELSAMAGNCMLYVEKPKPYAAKLSYIQCQTIAEAIEGYMAGSARFRVVIPQAVEARLQLAIERFKTGTPSHTDLLLAQVVEWLPYTHLEGRLRRTQKTAWRHIDALVGKGWQPPNGERRVVDIEDRLFEMVMEEVRYDGAAVG